MINQVAFFCPSKCTLPSNALSDASGGDAVKASSGNVTISGSSPFGKQSNVYINAFLGFNAFSPILKIIYSIDNNHQD